MAHLIIQSIFVLSMFSTVMADCYRGHLHESWTNGRREQYCLTHELKPQKVSFGQILNTDDCYRCSCDQNGLHCCGFGIKAGTNAQKVPVPEGCMLVVDSCDYYFADIRTGQRC